MASKRALRKAQARGGVDQRVDARSASAPLAAPFSTDEPAGASGERAELDEGQPVADELPSGEAEPAPAPKPAAAPAPDGLVEEALEEAADGTNAAPAPGGRLAPPRAGHSWARVLRWDIRVRGRGEDNVVRMLWKRGEAGIFSDRDIASLPEDLERL